MTMQILSEGTRSAQRILRHVPQGSGYVLDTGKVLIGCAYTPRPPVATRDGETLQEALLEPRTARPASVIARVASILWSRA